MFVVFWIDVDGTQSKQFESHEMTNALSFMEDLRKRQREGEEVSFVAMCSENPNSVGKPGVAEVGPDYNWTKRRETMKK